MKTLDEVIDIMEHPLYGADEDFAEIAEDDIADALHYLKALRDAKDTLEAEKDRYAEAVKNCERAENKYRKLAQNLSERSKNEDA